MISLVVGLPYVIQIFRYFQQNYNIYSGKLCSQWFSHLVTLIWAQKVKLPIVNFLNISHPQNTSNINFVPQRGEEGGGWWLNFDHSRETMFPLVFRSTILIKVPLPCSLNLICIVSAVNFICISWWYVLLIKLLRIFLFVSLCHFNVNLINLSARCRVFITWHKISPSFIKLSTNCFFVCHIVFLN